MFAAVFVLFVGEKTGGEEIQGSDGRSRIPGHVEGLHGGNARPQTAVGETHSQSFAHVNTPTAARCCLSKWTDAAWMALPKTSRIHVLLKPARSNTSHSSRRTVLPTRVGENAAGMSCLTSTGVMSLAYAVPCQYGLACSEVFDDSGDVPASDRSLSMTASCLLCIPPTTRCAVSRRRGHRWPLRSPAPLMCVSCVQEKVN